ncbi:cysteine-rich CWC family protein [Halopseudomonas maritima]|uniref:cysteine-rich CWC family protein n=1 Tax=Halopseudomonas maritima TaxID=2918528 RepID=UPI0037C0AE7C|nr:cysteine-rich CWC family protein [Halopseudomonas maritima]
MTQTCPFCQQENSCTASSGDCWCFRLSVPSSMLALLPAEARNRDCICQACVRACQAAPDDFAARVRQR